MLLFLGLCLIGYIVLSILDRSVRKREFEYKYRILVAIAKKLGIEESEYVKKTNCKK